MKTTKKNWLALLAVVALLGTLVCTMAISVAAASGETNVNKFEFSATEVQPGDTFTLTFGTAAMKVQVFTLAMDFDNSLFEVTKVNTKNPTLKYMGITYDEELEEDVEAEVSFGCTAVSTIDEMNASGHMGMSFVHTEDREYLAKGTLIRITFKVKEGASGTTTMSFYESSAGTDQCLDTKEAPSGTQTVTIKGTEPACEHTSTKLVPNTDGTHNVVCTACNEPTNSNVTCTGSDDGDCTTAVECACGNVVTAAKDAHVAGADDGDCTTAVKCANCDQIATAAKDKHTGGTATCSKLAECSVCGKAYGELNSENHAFGDIVTGWYKIGSDWYYGEQKVCANNGEHNVYAPVTGLTRVPYNTELGHAPNADDLAYYNANKSTSQYTDAETAVYNFAQDGKLIRTTGIVVDGETTRYAVDGVIAWHPGFVKVGEELYYFVGDIGSDGNSAANGIVYVTRGTGEDTYMPGYIWFEEGKVRTELTGIYLNDSELYYFKNGVRQNSTGLVEIEEGKYIYVRTSGMLATGDYWVTAEKANGLVKGNRTYTFAENGYMTSDVDKNGIVDGKYYVEGVLTYAGLIEIDGDIYYVNSKGEVVTGTYYVTKTNDMEGFARGDKLVFGEDGKMETIKDGIVEENGALYYYEKNHLKCGAGLIKVGEDYYYVRSSGMVQTGYYYITNTNGIEGFTAGSKCKFGEDGKLLFVCE